MSHQTIAELLSRATLRLQDAGVEDPGLDAQILMSHALGVERSRVLAMFREPLPARVRRPFEALVARRAGREPTAYITGKREFYGRDFTVAPGVLIPRPETELLVELALEVASASGHLRIADVGTGSGALAVTIAACLPSADLVALDTSPEALTIASTNAVKHGVAERVRFVEADLLGEEFDIDLVLANLPYISEEDWFKLAPEIRGWEPREALVGGPLGTEIIERLIASAARHLAPHAMVGLEFGIGQGPTLLQAAARSFPRATIHVRKDLAGIDRVLIVKT